MASVASMSSPFIFLLLILASSFMTSSHAIRFGLDRSREECFTENVEYDGDTVQVSYVVIQDNHAWSVYGGAQVALTIDGPGNFRTYIHENTAKQHTFTAKHRGPYKLCFESTSPYAETITVDLDVHIGHTHYHDQKLQDDHVDPLKLQIAKLQDAIESVSYEQHWLNALKERQTKVTQKLSRRLVSRAVGGAGALIGASVLQVYLLQRLFNKKLNRTRV